MFQPLILPCANDDDQSKHFGVGKIILNFVGHSEMTINVRYNFFKE